MTLTRRKKIAFALVTIGLSVAGTLMLLLAADLVIHHRAERSAGLNRWGYRGPVVGAKKANELRVVMLGGSTVFGYGVQWHESIPANLERALNRTQPFSVVNLGFNNEGAYAFVPTLRDFDYLDYDIVVLYEGYNDLPGDEGPNTSVFRRNSAVFRLTGYFPILPMYLDEKAMLLRHGGNLDAGYDAAGGAAPKTVFRPNIAARTSATALDTVAKVANSLGAQLGRFAEAEPPALARVSTIGCRFPWVNYCDAVHAAVRYLRSANTKVIVAGQPRMSQNAAEAHERQQAMLARMIRAEFGSDAHVMYVDFADAIDLNHADVTFDAMHLNADGNRMIAEALAPHVLKLAAQ